MSDGTTSETMAAIIAAFTEADYDRVPELVQKGLDEGLAARVLLDDGAGGGYPRGR